MIIAMHAPNGGTTTLSLKGGLDFSSIRPLSMGPCEILQWNSKEIAIKNCIHIRIQAECKLTTGSFHMKTIGFNSVMWIRLADDNPVGQPEMGIQGDKEQDFPIFTLGFSGADDPKELYEKEFGLGN